MTGGEPGRAELPQAFERPSGVSAAEAAYRYLKELIVDLVLPPETGITEKQIGEATGLSRTPIREALLRLREERLVQLIPRGGAVVSGITARQVRELSETRLLIEMNAAEKVCVHRIDVAAQLVQLIEAQEELIAVQAASAANGTGQISVGDLIRVDRQFHVALVAAPGNTLLTTLYESLGDHQQRTGVLAFSLDPSRRLHAPEQHRRIASALSEYDLDAAYEAIIDHLQEGSVSYERFLSR